MANCSGPWRAIVWLAQLPGLYHIPVRAHSMNRNPGIRLVSVDLDGTLIRSDRTSAPEGVRLRVVINTIRNIGSVQEMCAAWGFTDPVICTNGGQILASPQGPSDAISCRVVLAGGV